jgi:hypothetical protein
VLVQLAVAAVEERRVRQSGGTVKDICNVSGTAVEKRELFPQRRRRRGGANPRRISIGECSRGRRDRTDPLR